jgi:hypothetical protein
MQFRAIRTTAGFLSAVAITGILLSGCTDHTTATPARPAATVAPCPPVPQDYIGNTENDAVAYLSSPGRAACFKSLAPKAGALIAQRLQAGKFGKVKRYDEYKNDLPAGYVGWGGISTLDNEKFTWVYWDGSGNIDYAKPIIDLSLNNVSNSPATGVHISGPDGETPSGDFGSYWAVSKNTSTVLIQVTDATEFGNKTFHASSLKSGISLPVTINGLEDLDNQALDQFRANMAGWFGPSWDK